MKRERPATARRGEARLARRGAALLGVAAGLTAAGVLAGIALGGLRSTAGRLPATTGAMAGMAMGTTTTGGMAMPMPVPMQTLGSATWQGMKIVARASTPLPFVVFTGTTERMVKPTKKDSMHLMVMLSDVEGGMPIPYASVWATITKAGKVVFDERQWPMLSRYMGPHYGNDVALPGKGKYHLTLLISPPQAARHMEYANVWLKPHRVTMTFDWKGKSGG
jgi:hypothetical protein